MSGKRKRTPTIKSKTTTVLPTTAPNFPDIMLGTYRMKDMKVLNTVMNECLPVCRGLDTAAAYCNHGLIGKVGGTEEHWVQTKLWRSVKSKDVVKKIRKDLKELKIKRLDCWLLHWPGPGRHLNFPPVTRTDIEVVGARDEGEESLVYEVDDVRARNKDDNDDDDYDDYDDNGGTELLVTKVMNENPSRVVKCPENWSPQTRLEVWSEMSKCVDLGLTRYLGACNFTLTQLRAVVEHCRANNLHKPAVLQNEFHPYIKWDQELFDYCKDEGIRFQGHSCLGGGAAGGKVLLENRVVGEIAKGLCVTAADVLFRYAHKKIGNVIVKSVRVERVLGAVEELRNPDWDIGAEDMRRLEGLAEGVELVNFDDGVCLFSWLREFSPSRYD
ncbi:hypothetical protein TrLO_g12840 [Triparma laevis f. longispina]|uniref:NADP-dependent oxidoreductase domain-containing protein n=1 Tax=Triparma laevis f. longispina TaxID=1714387 RepID=A0A9W7KYW9_9STRA|nr:hypothetical protein TrLO_g12840 [Triparma laevis f. longispina]